MHANASVRFLMVAVLEHKRKRGNFYEKGND